MWTEYVQTVVQTTFGICVQHSDVVDSNVVTYQCQLRLGNTIVASLICWLGC